MAIEAPRAERRLANVRVDQHTRFFAEIEPRLHLLRAVLELADAERLVGIVLLRRPVGVELDDDAEVVGAPEDARPATLAVFADAGIEGDREDRGDLLAVLEEELADE